MTTAQRPFRPQNKNMSQPLPDQLPTSGIKLAPHSMVVGVFGGKGSGKSLLAAYLSLLWHEQHDRPILYFPESLGFDKETGQKYPLGIEGDYISLAEMFTGTDRMDGAIIYWDEMQALLNKFRAASFSNRALLTFLQQIRKRGAVLLYTSNAPSQLDRGLGEQTDWHAYCRKFTDPRCERFGNGEHLRFCNDWIRINWVDTQGATGVDKRSSDGRRRLRQNLPGILRFYGIYNTYASVDPYEIAAWDKGAIENAYEDKKAGSEFGEFTELVQGWVADLVEQTGAKTVGTTQFAKLIERNTNGEHTPSAKRLGKALTALGLTKDRNSRGTRYELPDRAQIPLWLATGAL